MTLCFIPRLFKKMERPWKNFSHFKNSFLFCSWPLDERTFVMNYTCRLSHGIKHRDSIQCDNINCIKNQDIVYFTFQCMYQWVYTYIILKYLSNNSKIFQDTTYFQWHLKHCIPWFQSCLESLSINCRYDITWNM